MGCCSNKSTITSNEFIDCLDSSSTPQEQSVARGNQIYLINYLLDVFTRDALSRHNNLRRAHGASPLMLNPELVKMAQAQADKIASSKLFVKSGNKYNEKKLGENIAMVMKGRTNGNLITNIWYDENKTYNYKNHSYQAASENFSQLLWKGTREFGFGVAKGKHHELVAVAYYYPAGNVTGEFEKNILPAK